VSVNMVMDISPRYTRQRSGSRGRRKCGVRALTTLQLWCPKRLIQVSGDSGRTKSLKALASHDSSHSQSLLMAKHQQSEAALAAASHILDRGEAAALSEESGREMSCRAHVNAR
jgi:hypothetical protein